MAGGPAGSLPQWLAKLRCLQILSDCLWVSQHLKIIISVWLKLATRFLQKKVINQENTFSLKNWPGTRPGSNQDTRKKYRISFFAVPIQNNVILAYHRSIKMYTGLQLVNLFVYMPIIGHLYSMTSFFKGTIKSFLGRKQLKNA